MAEDAQKAYNVIHNDLARKMDEQNKATIPRTEAEQRTRQVEERINEIRNIQLLGGGANERSKRLKDESRANIASSAFADRVTAQPGRRGRDDRESLRALRRRDG